MRLVDALLRQGHLSEQALVEALMTGDRPAHLDGCEVCTMRAADLNRWLDAVRDAATEAADAAFPAERLAAQQAQIQRRLEQLDEPSRIIAFPVQSRADRRDSQRRRIAPGWLGVAAAAGLVIGLIGGQASARLTQSAVVVDPTPAPVQEPATAFSQHTSLLDMNLDAAYVPEVLSAMNDATPRVVNVSLGR